MSSTHPTDLFPLYALGMLDDDERCAVEAHLAACAECVTESLSWQASTDALALALPPEVPSPGARERLLAEARGGRFARFLARVAKLLDVPETTAADVLENVDDASLYQPLPYPGHPGVEFYAPPTGPRLAGATVGVLRIQPGARFPQHRHVGFEQVLVLEGGFRDEASGESFHPGMLQEMDAGTAHSFVGLPGTPCICIGVVLEGIEVG